MGTARRPGGAAGRDAAGCHPRGRGRPGGRPDRNGADVLGCDDAYVAESSAGEGRTSTTHHHGAAAKQLRLTGGTVSNAHRQLTVNGPLHDGGAFVDPLFADWFRQTLPLT